MYGWTLLGLVVISVAAYLLLSGFLKTWRLYRGVQVITCPENLQPAAVRVAAFDAAKWHAISGEEELRLNACSRWPERAGCDQQCLSQIQEAPGSCSLHAIVSEWYRDKSCDFCSKEIGDIAWHERPAAIRLADGTLREWKEIAPEQVTTVFATATPVCWSCYMVENFRHEHPEMVIARERGVAHTEKPIEPSAAVY